MKKQLLITALAIATSISSFAQGYVSFASTKASGLWYAPDATGSGTVARLGNNGIMVGFLWADSGTPLVGALGTATNNTAVVPSWDAILNDPAFHFALNGSTLVSVVVNNSGLAQGGFGYNNAVSFPLAGSVAGASIQAMAVAWDSQYATPQLAAAANSYLGYSKLITYATGPTAGSAVSTFATSGMTAFGVSPVPEPGTFALAGLGLAAMLVSRRRK